MAMTDLTTYMVAAAPAFEPPCGICRGMPGARRAEHQASLRRINRLKFRFTPWLPSTPQGQVTGRFAQRAERGNVSRLVG